MVIPCQGWPSVGAERWMDDEWREILWYTTQLAVVFTLAEVAMNEPLEFSKLTRVRGSRNGETAAVMVATVDNGKEMVRRDAGGSDA